MKLESVEILKACTDPLERLVIARSLVLYLKEPPPEAVTEVLNASPQLWGEAQKAERNTQQQLARMAKGQWP